MTTVSEQPVLTILGYSPAECGTILLRGIGQVMFQGHAGPGLLFLIGIAVASP